MPRDKAHRREYERISYNTNPRWRERKLRAAEAYYQKHADDPEYMKRRSKIARQWALDYPDRAKEIWQRYAAKVRIEVFTHYSGGGRPRCVCCNEQHIEFLTIDHINGGGAKQARELGKKGVVFYAWLRKQGYPKGYQTLCYNCNNAKARHGKCPHTTESASGSPSALSLPQVRDKHSS